MREDPQHVVSTNAIGASDYGRETFEVGRVYRKAMVDAPRLDELLIGFQRRHCDGIDSSGNGTLDGALSGSLNRRIIILVALFLIDNEAG